MSHILVKLIGLIVKLTPAIVGVGIMVLLAYNLINSMISRGSGSGQAGDFLACLFGIPVLIFVIWLCTPEDEW